MFGVQLSEEGALWKGVRSVRVGFWNPAVSREEGGVRVWVGLELSDNRRVSNSLWTSMFGRYACVWLRYIVTLLVFSRRSSWSSSVSGREWKTSKTLGHCACKRTQGNWLVVSWNGWWFSAPSDWCDSSNVEKWRGLEQEEMGEHLLSKKVFLCFEEGLCKMRASKESLRAVQSHAILTMGDSKYYLANSQSAPDLLSMLFRHKARKGLLFSAQTIA